MSKTTTTVATKGRKAPTKVVPAKAPSKFAAAPKARPILSTEWKQVTTLLKKNPSISGHAIWWHFRNQGIDGLSFFTRQCQKGEFFTQEMIADARRVTLAKEKVAREAAKALADRS